MCNFCNATNSSENLLNIFSDEEYDIILSGIFYGLITKGNLNYNYYFKTAEKLTDGIYFGFGETLQSSAINSKNYNMLKALRENVYVFSGAKNYQMTRDISLKLRDMLIENDNIVTLDEFKDKSLSILKNYSENYLTTEYNAAIGQAQSASKWIQYEDEKDLYPLLKYQTIGDGRVRPTHADLDGIVRPVDDRFWDLYAPLNGWNCRCLLVQTGYDEDSKTPLSIIKKPNDVPEIFQFNVGKEKVVFSKKHPYFEVPKEDKQLALNNFNLPKVK